MQVWLGFAIDSVALHALCVCIAGFGSCVLDTENTEHTEQRMDTGKPLLWVYTSATHVWFDWSVILDLFQWMCDTFLDVNK